MSQRHRNVEGRLGDKAYFDSRKRLRMLHQQINVGDLVLLPNTRSQTSWDKKVDNNWLGPYRVREVSPAGFYRLTELDGSELQESVAGNRIKEFFSREGDPGVETEASRTDPPGDDGSVSDVA